VALSLVLLIGAGLLIRSYERITNANPGFDPRNVLSLRVTLPGAKYKTPEAIAAFYRQLEQRVRAMPGVVHAEVSRRPPGTLRVTVEEAVPVALVPSSNRLKAVDATGKVLPFDPTVGAEDLPLIRQPDSLVTRFLAKLQEVDATLYGRVSVGWRVQRDVVIQVDNQRYWFRPDATAEAIRAVTAVAQDLTRKGRAFAELDGRFAGYVVVRWKAA